jgi:hypothetical protein
VSPVAATAPRATVRPAEEAVTFAASQDGGPGALVTLTQPGGDTGGAEPGSARQPRALHLLPWPLLAILAIQAALALRQVRSGTAVQDEVLDQRWLRPAAL